MGKAKLVIEIDTNADQSTVEAKGTMKDIAIALASFMELGRAETASVLIAGLRYIDEKTTQGLGIDDVRKKAEVILFLKAEIANLITDYIQHTSTQGSK